MVNGEHIILMGNWQKSLLILMASGIENIQLFYRWQSESGNQEDQQ